MREYKEKLMKVCIIRCEKRNVVLHKHLFVLISLLLVRRENAAVFAEAGSGAEGHLETTGLLGEEGTAGVEASLDGLDEGVQFSFVFGVDGLEGAASQVLLADELTEASLVLDDGVGDLLSTAEGGHPHDEFDGVDVGGDDDDAGGTLLDGTGDFLETGGESEGSLGGDGLALVVSLSLGGSGEAFLAGLGGFGLVLLEELEEVGAGGAVESLTELVDGGGDLHAAFEDALLTLGGDEFGPAHEAGDVTLEGNVATSAEVLGAGDVLGGHGLVTLGGGGGGLLLGLGGVLGDNLSFLTSHFVLLEREFCYQTFFFRSENT